jgi:hypothetical protein
MWAASTTKAGGGGKQAGESLCCESLCCGGPETKPAHAAARRAMDGRAGSNRQRWRRRPPARPGGRTPGRRCDAPRNLLHATPCRLWVQWLVPPRCGCGVLPRMLSTASAEGARKPARTVDFAQRLLGGTAARACGCTATLHCRAPRCHLASAHWAAGRLPRSLASDDNRYGLALLNSESTS